MSTLDWFGVGDLPALVLCTLPFLLVLVVSGIALARTLAHRPTWLGLVIGGIAGIGLGFLWTWANARMLGPWFGAWSFPVLLCWTTGGALALASAATSQAASGWRRFTLESMAYLLVATAALYAYGPAVVYLRRDQHLILVYGRIRPHGTGPAIRDLAELLSPEDKELLARAVIGGSIEVLGGHSANTTTRPRARILVLLSRPVDRVERLLQPDATAVLYLQEGAGFRRFPPDAKLLSDRAVELYPAGTEGRETRYRVEQAGGARSGGTIKWCDGWAPCDGG